MSAPRRSRISTAPSGILLIGTNPRVEAPVLNARIRKAWTNGAQIGVIGPAVDLTYDYHDFGTDRAALAAHLKFAQENKGPAGGIVIVGQGALNEADGEAVLAHAMAIAASQDAKILILHTAAARVGAMDVGAVTEGGLAAATEGAEVIYNLGADEVDIAPGPFVIYQGSHGDRGANRADIILPGAAYTEENGLFVNTEGRPQLAHARGLCAGRGQGKLGDPAGLVGGTWGDAALGFAGRAARTDRGRGAASGGDRPGAARMPGHRWRCATWARPISALRSRGST